MEATTHQYKGLTPEQYEELFSNFLFNSWSFSKIASFARNEKAFEMQYIYNMPQKQASSSIAGTAYHAALKFYFSEFKEGIIPDLAALQIVAFAEIDKVLPHQWKIQKTCPTIQECINKATDVVTALLNNFLSEVDVYLDDVEEVLEVELYYNEFLTICNTDVPLPVHAIVDLKVLTKEGRICIIDHKSKGVFTNEQELKFSMGKQSITYVLADEAKNGVPIDEVWFVENKYSKNKDGSPQLICLKVVLDASNRRLYELMLYEPLKRMLESIQDPNYIYLINENDMFVDKAELYEFWAQILIADLGDFDIPEDKKELIGKRLKKIRDVTMSGIDPSTIKKFRKEASTFIQYDLSNKDMDNAEKIEHTLKTLRNPAKVMHQFIGYSSDTYLLEVSAGSNISSVQKFKLDIASALGVPSIRIMKDLFVYENRSYLAVEASKKRTDNLLWDASFLVDRKIPIGKTNLNELIFWNMDSPATPHILICGSTGSGKSISIASIIEYAKVAGMDSIIIFDVKFEFKAFASNTIKVINDIEDIEKQMEEMVTEMNELVKSGQTRRTLIIFDEFADAVANSKSGKELDEYEMQVVGNYKDGSPKMQRVKTNTKKTLEENLRILLQKGRSCGFRIVAATQRASVKVISGDAKTNFGIKICYRVSKAVDSMVILDEEGAEALSGFGDGLISSPDYFGLVRFQSFIKK